MPAVLGDGLDAAQLMNELEQRRTVDHQRMPPAKAQFGARAAGPCALANMPALAVCEAAMRRYAWERYSGAVPSLAQFSEEILAALLRAAGAGDAAGGCLTASGSESGFLAVKAARDAAASRGVAQAPFEIILPASAHISLFKAAAYLGLVATTVPLKDGVWLEPSDVARAITPHTIMIAASASEGNFGLIDPVEPLAELARQAGLWLHVDACIGGFIAHYLRLCGEPVPVFDLRIDGVSSMSVDLHKYAYGPQGLSALLYSDRRDLAHQAVAASHTIYPDYGNAILTGTRPAEAVVGAWAMLRHLGDAGYTAIAERLIAVRRRLTAGIAAIDGLEIVGTPLLTNLAFVSRTRPMPAIADTLVGAGWSVIRLKSPAAIELFIDPVGDAIIDRYLHDLSRAAALHPAPSRQGPPDEPS